MSEIRINHLHVSTQRMMIDRAMSFLPPGKLDAEDSGNSEAVKEFVKIYEEFSTVVSDYISVMKNDLSRIESAAKQMEDVDIKEGNSFKDIKSGIVYLN